jgi:hypothetical protein
MTCYIASKLVHAFERLYLSKNRIIMKNELMYNDFVHNITQPYHLTNGGLKIQMMFDIGFE